MDAVWAEPDVPITKFIEQLQKLDWQQPPWSKRFPDIDITTTPCAPALNVVKDNRYCFPKLAPRPAPPKPDPTDCVKCPPGHLYGYGDPINGHWCCSVQVHGPPTGASCPSHDICCLRPGSKKHSIYGNDGCQGIRRCGINPANRTPCTPLPPAPSPPPKFTDFPADCTPPSCYPNATASWMNTFENNTEFVCNEK